MEPTNDFTTPQVVRDAFGNFAPVTYRPVSYSEIYDFQSCPYRWFLRYVLGLRPRFRTSAMEVGDAVHRSLAAGLAGGDVADGLAEWRDDVLGKMPVRDAETDAQVDAIARTAEAVTKRAWDALAALGYWTFYASGKPVVEREMKVDVVDRQSLKGYVDWIAFDPATERYWVVDFKTRNYFTSEKDEEASLQNAIYLALAQLTFPEIRDRLAGTLTIQVKSAPPAEPKVNKDGTLSRAKIATDWATYEAAVVRAGQDPADYQDVRAKLDDAEFVRVTPVFRSAQAIRNVWDQVVAPAVRAVNREKERMPYALADGRLAAGDGVPVRALSPKNCSSCLYRDGCHAALKGWDARAAFAQNFDITKDAEKVFPDRLG